MGVSPVRGAPRSPPTLGYTPSPARVAVERGLLTDNGPPLADNFAEQLLDVAAVVPTRVFSSDIAATKPSPDAFGAACRALGAEPTRVVFVDDNPENVRRARDARRRPACRSLHHARAVAPPPDGLVRHLTDRPGSPGDLTH